LGGGNSDVSIKENFLVRVLEGFLALGLQIEGGVESTLGGSKGNTYRHVRCGSWCID